MKMTALMIQNVETLKEFHINQPLVIDNGNVEPDYGIITGFQYNGAKEIILVIKLIGGANDVIMLHPSSSKIKTLDQVKWY